SAAPPGDSRPWKWTVAKYHALINARILTEDDPVELLEDEIVVRIPKNPAHETARRYFRRALGKVLPPGYFTDDQAPVTLSDSEPESDLAVVVGSIEAFAGRHPRPSRVALVVEVVDSSLQTYRGRKQRIYARAEIEVYWVVDLTDRHVEVYSDPLRGRHPRY